MCLYSRMLFKPWLVASSFQNIPPLTCAVKNPNILRDVCTWWTYFCLSLHMYFSFPCREWRSTITDTQLVSPPKCLCLQAAHTSTVLCHINACYWTKHLYITRWFRKKGLQSVTGTDVNINAAQYVIVNCGCTVYSVARSGRNYSDFLNWWVYCSGPLRI